MCLAMPAKVVEIKDNVAIVDFGGIRREARIDFVKDVKVGDYVIVHTGFAIEKLDEKTALESLKAWEEVMKAMEE
ncbi:MAG: Ni-Fe hydrogenase maturation protein HypC [Thermococcales archaeon 44_46]|uniref:HypC/HybG/HupF family hydrogenase formation chaperone n=1 Tax=Thermococcus bergensis TaxID=2689387 RepID=UPI000746F67C|nr:HypC/HybG/HupF family hydrogenase formation chaperone [Thermococcus bergensis]KUJ99641.1 MAG: Ni-Fe hydrogenase maturation protein HypC [Thermococcales archaeon 44_46]MDK2783878.1 hydrogenase expression/formation protein HypC [Thermococcaceae archaeon]MCA6214275.1 HypC/HybG/HupF family hydrogenase formation chaperone [Thermococcus bergensis]MDK2854470.1 hydrogenase expression/formation protein HypC [Thermococcaceae archaeon]MDK2983494.1 hydrogenase expression/formation protein HypC [Thermoc